MQLALAFNMQAIVRYILKEYSYISSTTRQAKSLDARALVSGDLASEVLRTALIDSTETFYWVWQNYGDLFTAKQTLLDLSLFLSKYSSESALTTLLIHPTSLALLKSAPLEDSLFIRDSLPPLEDANYRETVA